MLQNQQFRKNLRSEVFSQTWRDDARLLCCGGSDPYCPPFARGCAALGDDLTQSIFWMVRAAHRCSRPSLWIPLRLNQRGADAWGNLRFGPLEMLRGPWLDVPRDVWVPRTNSTPQEPGPIHADIVRDNAPDTQCRLRMDAKTFAQGINGDFPVHVALRVPLDDGLSREEPHLHG